MLRKLSALTLAFLLLATPFAHADDASKRAKLEELFVVMHIQDLMQSVMKSSMNQGEQMMKSLIGGGDPTPAQQKVIDIYRRKLYTVVTEALAWDKLKPQYLDLYASTYTESDVDGILAFYKSPAGVDMVAKTPELITASQKIVLIRMQDLGPQTQAIFEDLQKQLKAAQTTPPSN